MLGCSLILLTIQVSKLTNLILSTGNGNAKFLITRKLSKQILDLSWILILISKIQLNLTVGNWDRLNVSIKKQKNIWLNFPKKVKPLWKYTTSLKQQNATTSCFATNRISMRCKPHFLDSIAVPVFVDWLSLSNPNNNLMTRQAGLSTFPWDANPIFLSRPASDWWRVECAHWKTRYLTYPFHKLHKPTNTRVGS